MLESLRENYVFRSLESSIGRIYQDKLLALYLLYLLFIVLLAVIGPSITPYEYDANLRGPSGQLLRAQPPSLAHPLGTTPVGHDVLSRIIYGARPTVITGLLGGTIIIGIGASVGITAGYVGGRVDDALMRFTDLVYGVPLLPFAIVLVALFGVGFLQTIVVIGMLLWRSSARVLRSQVLQIKERPFILAAKASGASTPRIIIKHILPNILPMAVFFFAIGIGNAIIIQASLAFLGVTSPFIPSWGIMLRNAYDSGIMGEAWWWSVPPGLLISFIVLSTVMLGRSIESRTKSEEAAMVEG